MVSTRPPTSKFSSPLSNPLVTTIIIIIIIIIFNRLTLFTFCRWLLKTELADLLTFVRNKSTAQQSVLTKDPWFLFT